MLLLIPETEKGIRREYKFIQHRWAMFSSLKSNLWLGTYKLNYLAYHKWWVLWENRPVQGLKQGCTYHAWWKCCHIYQTEGLSPERCSNFWLFWYQTCDCTSNKTNFTQFWRPKICQFFKLRTGQFSRDTRQMTWNVEISGDMRRDFMTMNSGC